MKKPNWRCTLLSRVVAALEGKMSDTIFVNYKLRKATLQDKDILKDLISRSARQIGVADYTAEQIEGALRAAFGVDTQLIQDGTYFVVESEGTLVGCGGWSRRRTLFGGDQHAERNLAELDPHIEPARIRAFFVEPKHARRGIGTAILKQCEADALSSGFSRMELMATLTGVKLYAQHDYIPGSPIQYELNPGLPIEFVPMSKRLLIKDELED